MASPYQVGRRYGERGRGFMEALSGYEMEKGKVPTREEAEEVKRGVKDGSADTLRNRERFR